MSRQQLIHQYFKVTSNKTSLTSGQDKKGNGKNASTPSKKVATARPVHRRMTQKTSKISENTRAKTPDKKCLPLSNSQNRSPGKVQEAQTEDLTLESLISRQFNTTPTKSRFTPKVSSPITPRRSTKTHTSEKSELILLALEQLNLAKQGAIPPNNFDLEYIYSNTSFHYGYKPVNTKVELKYEYDEVVAYGGDINSDIFFTSIIQVFSDPVNCGYFNEKELDFIYSIITLPIPAQRLLIRMLKRQRTWFRKNAINYPDLAPNTEAIFRLLAEKAMCTLEIADTELNVLLGLLHVDELRSICRDLKIGVNGKKEKYMQELKLFTKTKPIFDTTRNQSRHLCSLLIKKLGYCVKITDTMWSIFDRVLTLLIPNLDPKLTVAETFFMLSNVYKNEAQFPKMPEQRFPIFSTKEQLLGYIEAKTVLTEIYTCIEKKNLERIRELGCKAKSKLATILPFETKRLQHSRLPAHVKNFMPGYIWLKAVSVTVDAFKTIKTNMQEAIGILNILINQNCHLQNRKGQWYCELALIEMHHMKNIKNSAHAIQCGLLLPNVTEVDKINLVDRAHRIINRKKGMGPEMKRIQDMLTSMIEVYPIFTLALDPLILSVEAHSSYDALPSRKRIYCIETTHEKKTFGSVEDYALQHYRNLDFEGLHCEGALPIALFFILFWEQIYNAPVPGAYVSTYQHAPQDLYTEEFYGNRKIYIEMRREIIERWDLETLGEEVEQKFNLYAQYQSLIQTNLFESGQIKKIVQCIGIQGVLGICDRLIHNFKLWKSGFPDLIVWNYDTRMCKIVEVKSPNDQLSNKQKAWLNYLHQLEIPTEVFRVEEGTKKRKPPDRKT